MKNCKQNKNIKQTTINKQTSRFITLVKLGSMHKMHEYTHAWTSAPNLVCLLSTDFDLELNNSNRPKTPTKIKTIIKFNLK